MTYKNKIISGSFAENDLWLKASYGFLPPCIIIGVDYKLNARFISYVTSLNHEMVQGGEDS